jgi:hypothetical protein
MTHTPKPHEPLTPAAIDALLVDTTPWLSCDECFERMDVHVEALLADPDHRDEAMDRHLQGCAACADEARSLLGLLREGSV